MSIKKRLLFSLPHVFTLTGLFFGFSSIVCSIQAVNDLYLGLYYDGNLGAPHPERFLALAGIFIFLCSIFDFLDGFSARLLGSSSALGAELDSLADFLSFGIAPGVLFYTVTMIAGNHIPESGISYSVKGIVPYFFLDRLYLLKPLAFLFPICTIVRLARFKTGHSTTCFSGLPSTYAGAVVAISLTFNFYLTPIGKVIFLYEKNIPDFFLVFVRYYSDFFSSYFVLFSIYVLFSFLMISNFRFYRVDFIFRRFNISMFSPFTFILFFFVIVFFKYLFIFMASLYLFFSIFNVFLEWIRKERLDSSFVSQEPL